MHRNTSLLIVGLAIILATVIGLRISSALSPQVLPPTPTPTASPPVSPTPGDMLLLYQNTACGFSLSYPDRLTMLQTDSGAIFGDPDKPGDSVTALCQQEIPRVPLTDDRIETLSIGSVSATLYHDASQKDGTPIDKLIFTHPHLNIDIYIAGYGETFNAILRTVKLLP